MPQKRKGPAAGNRRAFSKFKTVYPILPCVAVEKKCFLRRLALSCRAAAMESPRAVRFGQFRELLQLAGGAQ